VSLQTNPPPPGQGSVKETSADTLGALVNAGPAETDAVGGTVSARCRYTSSHVMPTAIPSSKFLFFFKKNFATTSNYSVVRV